MVAEEGVVAAPVVAGAVVPAPGAAAEVAVVEVAVAAPVVVGAEEAVAGEGAVVASGVAGEVAAPVW
ncbi:hypothetical protein [Streptomyces microflavus]|uniref:hypothetical protein n=1 Tax=Streptomyces microflavus TaxID=1919 RepID=UPI0036EAE432